MIKFLKREKVMTIALALAIISMFFVIPDAQYIDYIDFRVLALLFCLMAVVKGFQSAGVLDKIAKKLLGVSANARMMARALCALCFFGSMLITNDVALITFVPLAILALAAAGMKKHILITVVLQTLSANLGSMLTPIGNPQNLYLFTASGMGIGEFFGTMWLPALVSLILIFIATYLIPAEKVTFEASADEKTAPAWEIICYCVLFIVSLLVVFRVLHWAIALGVTIIGMCAMRKWKLLLKVDYALLITFVGFFVLIGNLSRIGVIHDWVERILAGREFLLSVLFSQFMSNVPAAIFLSSFTDNFRALLLGTNVGGLGTLIASMASLISYKLYAREEGAKNGKYLLVFTALNVIFLAILSAIVLLAM